MCRNFVNLFCVFVNKFVKELTINSKQHTESHISFPFRNRCVLVACIHAHNKNYISTLYYASAVHLLRVYVKWILIIHIFIIYLTVWMILIPSSVWYNNFLLQNFIYSSSSYYFCSFFFFFYFFWLYFRTYTKKNALLLKLYKERLVLHSSMHS